jgi:hypothetical protein
MTPRASLVKLEPPVKQEFVENLYGPDAVQCSNIVATFNVEPTPITTLSIPKPLPTIPVT